MASRYRFDDVQIDLQSFRLTKAGRAVPVEPKALNLLVFLVENPGRLLARRELLDAVWSESFVSDHVLSRAVGQLRKLLDDDSRQSRYIETVPTLGYRFIAPVETETTEATPEVDPPPGAGPPPSPESPAADEIAPAPPARKQPWPRRPAIFTGGVLFLVILAAALYVWHQRAGASTAAPVQSVAVIPLTNLSGDAGQDYFADGMTDELITMLAKNSSLRVTSRTSIMQFKGTQTPMREIARKLGVDGILEGSVLRSGDKVHMTVQLIQASTDTNLWAESYDRNLNDAQQLPTEVAQSIAKRLKSTVPPSPAARYVNPEAHDAYVHGHYLWFTGDNELAYPYFKKATELQPDYALGWSGLADYYGAGSAMGQLDPRQTLPQFEAAATKAVQLDDSLPQAHLCMSALYLFGRWDWTGADREVLRAIELDPRFAEAYHLRGHILETLNRHQEAIESEKKAQELDPFSRISALANAFNNARDYDAAIKYAFQRFESTPNNISLHFSVAQAYWNKGMSKEAVEHEEKAYTLSSDKESALGIRRAFKQGGAKGVAQWRVSTLIKSAAKGYVSPAVLADAYGGLGEREKTLTLLEEAYRQHAPDLIFMQEEPNLDFLHSEERYRAIIRGMGMPPAY